MSVIRPPGTAMNPEREKAPVPLREANGGEAGAPVAEGRGTGPAESTYRFMSAPTMPLTLTSL